MFFSRNFKISRIQSPRRNPRLHTPIWLAIAILAITAETPRAEVSIDLDLVHGYDFYYATLDVVATNPAPVTYHRVESPSGTIWRQTNSDNITPPSFPSTKDLSILINECTNGLWKLILNVGDASEEHYTFSMTTNNVTTDLFGDIEITYPEAYSTVTNNPPTFQWTGPTHLPELIVSAYDITRTPTQRAALPNTATNWTPFSALAEGENRFYPRYSSNHYAGIEFSTPTNLVDGSPLTAWQATVDISTYTIQVFSIVGTPPPTNGYEASFYVNIQRDFHDGAEVFHIYPNLYDTSPEAITTHEVESPNALCLFDGNVSSSVDFQTMDDAITECEAGEWTLYFDRNSASNMEFRFSIDIENIDTNSLAQTVVLFPENGATDVYGNPAFSWAGPTGFTHVTVHSGITVSLLPPTATTWPDAPTLQPGSNQLSVEYLYENHPDIGISWPTNTLGKSVQTWVASGQLTSASSSSFMVASAPPSNLIPSVSDGNFTLNFTPYSFPELSYTLQYCTNLPEGVWMPVKNFIGTGAPLLFTLPATNPAAYYRISAEF